eukprot:CAMPEP_0178386086 /NCGR_PEP_ID=MMETSP0689_2-20121128/8367_1 /TAXON_ID=160604 /ORGANISM="Amphidinium massartii, Strain CS-259" /LENGTH=248 /DNA_ID=CAMNT_0020006389 /DNA_START=105 /DNA_END=851 /DNA_ORIENTATION=-
MAMAFAVSMGASSAAVAVDAPRRMHGKSEIPAMRLAREVGQQRKPSSPTLLATAVAAGLSLQVCRRQCHGDGKKRGSAAAAAPTMLRYTTQEILPSLLWLKTEIKGKALQPGDLAVAAIGGNDVCIGKTESGKLFAIGDKAPPTGLSFEFNSYVAGENIVDNQYGNKWDVFSGMPDQSQPWCPNPPVIGGIVAFVAGGPQAVAVFPVRETFLSGDIEVQVDVNAKKAYEAAYWKGVLDAQGKNDGTYY